MGQVEDQDLGQVGEKNMHQNVINSSEEPNIDQDLEQDVVEPNIGTGYWDKIMGQDEDQIIVQNEDQDIVNISVDENVDPYFYQPGTKY